MVAMKNENTPGGGTPPQQDTGDENSACTGPYDSRPWIP